MHRVLQFRRQRSGGSQFEVSLGKKGRKTNTSLRFAFQRDGSKFLRK
jgi:hypothetical protein